MLKELEMKFNVECCQELLPLRNHLELEGNRLTTLGEAEFQITQTEPTNHVPYQRGGDRFPQVAVAALGFEPSHIPGQEFYVSRFYDRYTKWLPQVFLGIPILGLMCGGISAQIPTGTCGTYVKSERIHSLFQRAELGVLLTDMKHSGWVTLRLSAEDGGVVGLETGIPAWGMYNVLEGVPGTLAQYFSEPEAGLLKESWTTTVLVSRYPYPRSTHTADNAPIQGLTDEIQRHLWLGEHTRFRNSVYTTATMVGVASAWGRTLGDSNSRAVKTCQSLSVPEVQYRTDSSFVAGPVWGKIKALGLVD